MKFGIQAHFETLNGDVVESLKNQNNTFIWKEKDDIQVLNFSNKNIVQHYLSLVSSTTNIQV